MLSLTLYYPMAIILALTLFAFKYIALARIKNIALQKIGLKTKSNYYLVYIWAPVNAVSLVVYWNSNFYHYSYFVDQMNNLFLIIFMINVLLMAKTWQNWKILTKKINELNKNLTHQNYKLIYKYAKHITQKNLLNTLTEIEITSKLSFRVFTKNKVYNFAWFGLEMSVNCENRKTKSIETENKFYNFKDFQKSLS